MAKAEIKTKPTESSVKAFLGKLEPEKRVDSESIVAMMEKATKAKPKMWGEAIVGFGARTYKSERTGREVDWLLIGFSPRKANLSLYVLCGSPRQERLLEKLGKHKRGQGCLYIKRLADVDTKVLEQLIQASVEHLSA